MRFSPTYVVRVRSRDRYLNATGRSYILRFTFQRFSIPERISSRKSPDLHGKALRSSLSISLRPSPTVSFGTKLSAIELYKHMQVQNIIVPRTEKEK
jgi:hypothetical protein